MHRCGSVWAFVIFWTLESCSLIKRVFLFAVNKWHVKCNARYYCNIKRQLRLLFSFPFSETFTKKPRKLEVLTVKRSKGMIVLYAIKSWHRKRWSQSQLKNKTKSPWSPAMNDQVFWYFRLDFQCILLSLTWWVVFSA